MVSLDANVTSGSNATPVKEKDEKHGRAQPPPPVKFKAKALYDFNGNSSTELSFKAGDEVEIVLDNLPGGWWRALINGKLGHVPSGFLEKITEKPPGAPLPVENSMPILTSPSRSKSNSGEAASSNSPIKKSVNAKLL